MRLLILSISAIILSLSSCTKNEPLNTNNNSEEFWLVDINDIIHFNSSFNKIQSLDTPDFLPITDFNIDESVEVIAYSYNNVVHAYPLSTLSIHEIINDSIGDHYFAVSHCPLTSSTLVWNRFLGGKLNSFGVSGKLYKENLIPYDRNTKSHWSQMLSLCINGDFIGETSQTSQLVRTKFSTLKAASPDALFLFHTECDSNSCTIDFKSAEDNPVDEGDSEIVDSEKYFGIVDRNTAVLIPLSGTSDTLSLNTFTAFGKNLIYISGTDYDLHLVFETEGRSFAVAQNSLPVIMKDNLANEYNIFGYVIAGPDLGKRLSSPSAYTAHTFAWKDLFKKKDVINF
jgi:hypothetical protein